MPNEEKKRLDAAGARTAEEIEAEEKFSTFFSTSSAQVPKALRNQPDEEEPHGLLDRLFRRKKQTDPVAEDPKPQRQPEELPTGEIRLDGGEDAAPQADLVLAWEETAAPQAVEAETPQPEQPAPAAPAQAEKPKEKKEKRAAKPRTAPLSPMEQREEREMQAFRDILDRVGSGEAIGVTASAPAEQPAAAKEAEPPQSPAPAPETVHPARETAPAMTEEPAAPQQRAEMPLPSMVFAEEKEESDLPPRQASLYQQTAVVEEVNNAPDEDANMSLSLEQDREAAEPASEVEPTEAAEPASAEPPEGTEQQASAEASAPETVPAEEKGLVPVPAEEQTEAEPETATERLRRMSAELTLRCALSGVLAVLLLYFGFAAAGGTAPIASLDPVTAPAAFYAANLLILAAALVVAWPVLRDGLSALNLKKGRPSADTMPAIAACGAALQAVIALINAQSYQTSSFQLLSGMAGLGLFTALLGSRVMLSAINSGYELARASQDAKGACRIRNKDLIRTLSRSLEQQDPWILVSCPLQDDADFMEQSFGLRASERRTRRTACILLGAGALAGLTFLAFGGGFNGCAAALTAVLCLGSPLSSTLVAAMATLRLQRAAAGAGAVVPGWAAIEELGGVDTLQVDADELFTADSVLMEDIRIFKGGRIDLAILYAASVLNQSCVTLRGLFSQIIEARTEILYPVKDFELHRGLGFSAWCDNNRVLIGNRAYMELEGVALPEKEYEDEHSKNGSLQVLYLAVSGSLHAMFVIRYVGGKATARGLELLQRENIRLMVSSQDPSLTARHITEVYHLPEGMITMLDGEQCAALEANRAALSAAKPEDRIPCCMIHRDFASMTAALRAAEQAQNAETTATTVQMVSVWVSVAIGILLTYAGSVGYLSLAWVLMYQIAWSGLTLAVCAIRQHN